MKRRNVLGVHITDCNLELAVQQMCASIETGRRAYVCSCPVYTIMQGHERPDVRAALNGADWATPDGMPVVWALRILGSRAAGRVYGPDLLLALSEISASRGYRQYYFGGAPGVAEDLAKVLKQRFSGLEVAGAESPPFQDENAKGDGADVARINEHGAHVIWVGLGSPKQDLWMARQRDQLIAPLLIGVGAAFDFFTGRQPQAPRWMQRSGLEWLFRLAGNPRRLWRRYLLNNPIFIAKFAGQAMGLRSYD